MCGTKCLRSHLSEALQARSALGGVGMYEREAGTALRSWLVLHEEDVLEIEAKVAACPR